MKPKSFESNESFGNYMIVIYIFIAILSGGMGFGILLHVSNGNSIQQCSK
jgi:Trk-type K+ transport system membrane component